MKMQMQMQMQMQMKRCFALFLYLLSPVLDLQSTITSSSAAANRLLTASPPARW